MYLLFGRIDHSLFDIWTLVHFLAGTFLGFVILFFLKKRNKQISLKAYFIIGIFSLLFWELIEVFYRHIQNSESAFFKLILKLALKGTLANESLLNIFSDMVIGAVGLTTANYLFRITIDNERLLGKDDKEVLEK